MPPKGKELGCESIEFPSGWKVISEVTNAVSQADGINVSCLQKFASASAEKLYFISNLSQATISSIK